MRTELAEQYYNSMEYTTKLRERLSLIEDCKANPIFRQRRIQEVWSKDPIVFIEDILLLKIPDLHNAIKPFFLFEYQKKILLQLKKYEDSGEDTELLVDKLRAMDVLLYK